MSTEQKILDELKKSTYELKKIRELLGPKPVPPPPKGFFGQFKEFMIKYRVLGLAVAFIMGLYLGGLVQSLVQDLLIPAIGLAIPGLQDLATYKLIVMNQSFGVGSFLAALITFIIVAIVIFVIVKVTEKWGLKSEAEIQAPSIST